jgi:cytochrome c oxidase subunit 1
LGITSEVIATNSCKPIFGYRAINVNFSNCLSTIVWGHHVYLYESFPSVYFYNSLIAIPSAVKAFITLLPYGNNLQLNPAMLFLQGWCQLFFTGGLTGIIL